MAGRTFATGSPQYGAHSPGSHVGSYYSIYAPAVVVTRLLVHTGLPAHQQVIIYDHLPEETVNFTRDVVVRRKVAFQDTLSSSVHSKWQQVKDDAIIKEIWRPDGGLAYSWAFLHAILRAYLKDPDWDAGESLIWRPLDRTWKAYAVDIVNVLLNGEEWGPEYRGYSDEQDEYGIQELQVWYKIRHEAQPQANLFMVGGSESPENEFFLNNQAT
jgi:hypothetical protein